MCGHPFRYRSPAPRVRRHQNGKAPSCQNDRGPGYHVPPQPQATPTGGWTPASPTGFAPSSRPLHRRAVTRYRNTVLRRHPAATLALCSLPQSFSGCYTAGKPHVATDGQAFRAGEARMSGGKIDICAHRARHPREIASFRGFHLSSNLPTNPHRRCGSHILGLRSGQDVHRVSPKSARSGKLDPFPQRDIPDKRVHMGRSST